MVTVLTTVALGIGLGSALAAVTITVTGSWSQTVGASNLASGAGSNLSNPVASPTDQLSIAVGSGSGSGSGNSHVTVQRVDTGWNSNLNIYVQMTSNNGTVSGGTAYLLVTTSPQTFITEKGNPTVGVQVKLDGLSLQVPPGTYTTGLLFTVIQP